MAHTEPQIGRYIHLEVEGIDYRVYYEENGQGIPLVCQPTAGADGQQFRHVITDPDITAKYRVLVFDLPYHGKSQPPASIKWWAQDYVLRKNWLFAFHEALNKALGLPRGVYMGSSVSGHFALDLAVERPDLYRAVIGLEAGLGGEGAGRLTYYRHPRVNAGDYNRVAMQAVCAPSDSEANKWEVCWAYGQGAPGILQGDIAYWCVGHDVRETVHLIDLKRCAVYVMNGEYDCVTGFPEGEAVVAKNPGIKWVPMHKLGHFPMTGNYPEFKKYILPVLDEIAATLFK